MNIKRLLVIWLPIGISGILINWFFKYVIKNLEGSEVWPPANTLLYISLLIFTIILLASVYFVFRGLEKGKSKDYMLLYSAIICMMISVEGLSVIVRLLLK
jgi:hypothetical protein